MQEQWQWQQEGTSWRGVGIYHITLTVTSREPLLGKLVIPDNDPLQARVEQTPLGRAILECQRSIPLFHPEIQILQYSLMPDHLHSIWYVRRPMEKSIRYVAQGFWRAAKKAGRAWTYINACLNARLSDGTMNETTLAALSEAPALFGAAPPSEASALFGAVPPSGAPALSPSEAPASSVSSIAPALSREISREISSRESKNRLFAALSSLAPPRSRENVLCGLLGVDDYSRLDPLFVKVPFIRPLSRRGQLQSMIHYVQLNPQRLATKRLMPGFFRVQENIVIAGRRYAAVGNILLLQAAHFATVHVRHNLVDMAAQGNNQPLRDYMNGCVLAARKGTVMVSPFISPKEKDIQNVLLKEQHHFIVLADNGFRDYYKPSAHLFDAVAEGRVLIISPWDYEAGKRHITRADCVALNAMADEIADM